MTWKWGGAKIITCYEATTLEEVAQENGFTGNSEHTVLFISRGRILPPEFTLHAHQTLAPTETQSMECNG
jgi:hypothetical protein